MGLIRAGYPPLIGCRVRNAANATGQNYTVGETAITCDTEDYDSHGFHSPSTNPERLTVPAELGGLAWDIFAHLSLSALTADRTVFVRLSQNASDDSAIENWVGVADAGRPDANVYIHPPGPIFMAAGDYLKFTVNVNGDTSVTRLAQTGMGISLRGS